MANSLTYIVEKGDTLYSIARKYDVPVGELRTANKLDSKASIYIGQHIIIPTAEQKSLSTKDIFYIVKKGDTLFSISMKYKTTVDVLTSLNNLKSSSAIFVGQKLLVSKASETNQDTNITKTKPETKNTDSPETVVSYKVQKGDTLYSIALDNKTTVTELRKLNNLTTSSVIKIGQSLIVSTAYSKKTNEIEDPRTYEQKKGNIALVWPVKAKEVAYVSGKISGVAITGSQKNESVTAIREGIVMYSGNYRGYGDVVFLKSSGNYIYMYSGLSSLSVKKGQHVGYREEIGKSGTDTYSGNPVINLMIYKNDNPIDPAKAPRG